MMPLTVLLDESICSNDQLWKVIKISQTVSGSENYLVENTVTGKRLTVSADKVHQALLG